MRSPAPPRNRSRALRAGMPARAHCAVLAIRDRAWPRGAAPWLTAPIVDADWRSRRHRRTRSLCASSFEHLVRPQQHRRWDDQPEGLGGLEVEDQLELGGLLDVVKPVASILNDRWPTRPDDSRSNGNSALLHSLQGRDRDHVLTIQGFVRRRLPGERLARNLHLGLPFRSSPGLVP